MSSTTDLQSSNQPIDNPTIYQTAAKLAQSPIPAWSFTAGLLLSPALRPKIPILNDQSTGYKVISSFSSKKFIPSYPSNAQVLIFSSFVGLGGFMCYDNDTTDGQIVVGVWSLLYFLTNLKRSVWNFKIYPKVLTSLALVNTAVYGGKYLNLI